MTISDDDADRLAHRVIMASFAGPTVPEWIRGRLAAGLGSVCLFGSNLPTGLDTDVRSLTDALHAAGPDCLVAVDEEGGDVTRLDQGTGSDLPGNAALGAVADPALTRAIAAGLGQRLAAAGIDLDLAPDADINSAPDNPVIGVRSFGAQPAQAAEHVAAFVTGLQEAGVAACAKHFPGHGDTTVDSHLGLPIVGAGMDLLARRELLPFAAAVRAGAAAVMTAHLLVPAVDGAQPATTSAAVLGLLRRGLGFRGVICTDALDMVGISGPDGYGSVPRAAVAALAAGADLLCLGPGHGDAVDDELVGTVVAAIRRALAAGRLDAERLAGSVARVDTLAERTRRRVGPGGPDSTDGGRPASRRLARSVAARAIRVSGAVPDLAGARVIRLRTAAGVAAGEIPWGIGPALAARLPGTTTLDLNPPPDGREPNPDASTDTIVANGIRTEVDTSTSTSTSTSVDVDTDRPLVAVVRDAHRHPWVSRWLAAAAARRPDLVVVEMGWPGPVDLPGCCQVWTYGASRVAAEAAADLLAGHSAAIRHRTDAGIQEEH